MYPHPCPGEQREFVVKATPLGFWASLKPAERRVPPTPSALHNTPCTLWARSSSPHQSPASTPNCPLAFLSGCPPSPSQSTWWQLSWESSCFPVFSSLTQASHFPGCFISPFPSAYLQGHPVSKPTGFPSFCSSPGTFPGWRPQTRRGGCASLRPSLGLLPSPPPHPSAPNRRPHDHRAACPNAA